MTADSAVDLSPLRNNAILKTVVKEGAGTLVVPKGANVKVHYTGRLLSNNEVFDSSRDRNEPFEFVLGKGSVIKGWEIGIATMKKGEIAEFTIQPEYGYGDRGFEPTIPKGAALIFEVEVIGWTGEDISPGRDGTVLYMAVAEGTKFQEATEMSTVEVHVTGMHNDRVFMDKDLTYTVGESTLVGLPYGIDIAMPRICVGGKSAIELKGAMFTYGNNPPEGSHLPPNAPLYFTVFFKKFVEKVPQSWEMIGEDSLKYGLLAKNRGSELMKAGHLKEAQKKYYVAEKCLESTTALNEEQLKRRSDLLLIVHNNLAIALLNDNDAAGCLKYALKALEIDPTNLKALYRRGSALFATNDFDDALKVFEEMLTHDADNAAAKAFIARCEAKKREMKENEKKRFSKMLANNRNTTASVINSLPSPSPFNVTDEDHTHDAVASTSRG